MGQNTGYLTASSNTSSDETLTLAYAVEPIVKHLLKKGYRKILCPFSLWHSKYVDVLKKNGFEVLFNDGEQNFFDLTKEELSKLGVDCIVDNPPFSKKKEILEHLYELEIPFAVLFPQNTLQGKFVTSLYMKHGLEYLGFDGRICFYTKSKESGDSDKYIWTHDDLKNVGTSTQFATGYFCKNLLDEKLMFENLERKIEPYCDDAIMDFVIDDLTKNEERWNND